MKKIFLIIFIFGIFFTNLIPKNSLAFSLDRGLETGYIKNTKIFLEDVPGMEKVAREHATDLNDPGIIISNYLEWLIQLSVIIGSILAMVYIIIGGAQYMTTDMFQKKAEGKSRISNAILGLIFLIVGYVLFKEINPNILNFQFNYKASQKVEGVKMSETSTKISDVDSISGGYDFTDFNDEPDPGYNPGKPGEKPIKKSDYQKESDVSQTSQDANKFVDNAKKEANWWNGRKECDSEETKERINEYWKAVDGSNRDCKSVPWSAAFITYITEKKLQGAAHYQYVKQVADKRNNEWVLLNPKSVAPKKGDVICRWRDEPYKHKSHCDIVISMKNNKLRAIGGNVSNTVRGRTYNLMNNILVKKGKYDWFAILRKK